MRSRTALIGLVALAAFGFAAGAPPAWAQGREAEYGTGQSPKEPLNTLIDLTEAVQICWKWPPIDDVQSGMTVTILLSFKRNGEILGARLTHQSQATSPQERDLYYRALADMMRRCSPLPFTDGLGNAVAGRPFTFRFNDNRKQKKA